MMGLSIRAKSSILWSSRASSGQARMARRMPVAAALLTAGLKLAKYLPQRFFDRQGRDVDLRKSNFSFG
jgi:hypothetical protein